MKRKRPHLHAHSTDFLHLPPASRTRGGLWERRGCTVSKIMQNESYQIILWYNSTYVIYKFIYFRNSSGVSFKETRSGLRWPQERVLSLGISTIYVCFGQCIPMYYICSNQFIATYASMSKSNVIVVVKPLTWCGCVIEHFSEKWVYCLFKVFTFLFMCC